METIGKFFTGLILLILTAIIGGFIMVKFWEWFVLSVFTLPSLNLIQAIGFSYFLGWLTYRGKEKKDKEFSFEKFMDTFIDTLVFSGLLFLIGWLIHLLY
jgi:hypothetical protein